MKLLIILRGAPGCGKSTWAKNNFEGYIICPDNIRLMYCAPEMKADGTFGISQKADKYVWEFVLKEWDVEKYKSIRDLKYCALIDIDMFLEAFEHRTLSAELNQMQGAVDEAENFKDKLGCFEYKQDIPFYFWNLVLRVYNLEIRKWGN